MKHIKPFFTLIIFSQLLLTNLKSLSPLSECNKGRTTKYTGWENGGICGFGNHTNVNGPTYLYPIAPNSGLFVSSSHCGICYEMVGPTGVIRGRVENYCPENDSFGFCSGDMYHISIPENASNYVMGSEELSYISFRMVECGFSGNIKILMDEESDNYYLYFIVLDHNLGVSSVSIKEYESTTWTSLERDDYNYWTYEPELDILFPIEIRIYSINGDYVTVNIKELKDDDGIYEANSNFKIPDNTFFNLTSLEKIEIPSGSKNCCEFDLSEFSHIYKNGEINDYYFIYSQKASLDYNSNEIYQDGKSMNVKFESMGKLFIKTSYPIRADQFGGVSIAIKTTENCSNCLYIKDYDNQNNNQVIKLDSENKWKIYRITFENLGIENKQFNGIILYYNKQASQPFEIYIGSIDLLGKRNKPDAGICFSIPDNENEDKDKDKEKIPVIPIINEITTDTFTEYKEDGNSTSYQTDIESTVETDNETSVETDTDNNTIIDIDTTTIETNGTSSLINVNILYIIPYSQSPLFITINCESFNKINDENLNLLFTSKNNSISFQTENCILPNSGPISSFSCKLPNNMPNGIYKISSSTDKYYTINYSKSAIVNNGVITFNNIDVITEEIEDPTQESTEISTNIGNISEITNEVTDKIYEPIFISNNFKQVITKGEKITFQITPIEKDNYKLENNEIIFENENRTTALYLKKCEEQKYNGKITLISCTLSDNIMKGNYTVLAEGQNVFISPGNSISLISESSTGGLFTENIDLNINTNLARTELNNLTFNILYYNSSVKPGNLFPHEVKIYGNKKAIRNLEDSAYSQVIKFPRCNAGKYSNLDKDAISSIICKVPDYIPAGTYSKLESDGFDVMPNSRINLVFNDDFNRTKNKEDDILQIEKSSSSSKTWIIWLIVGILVLILIILVIIICIVKKKASYEDTGEISKVSSKGDIRNTSQDKNRSDYSN